MASIDLYIPRNMTRFLELSTSNNIKILKILANDSNILRLIPDDPSSPLLVCMERCIFLDRIQNASPVCLIITVSIHVMI